MVTKPVTGPCPGGNDRSHIHPMGKPPRPAPASRCQPPPALSPQGQAAGLIRLSGRIPAGGDTQSIIMSPGQRPSPAHLGKAGCSPPAPGRHGLVTTHRKGQQPEPLTPRRPRPFFPVPRRLNDPLPDGRAKGA